MAIISTILGKAKAKKELTLPFWIDGQMPLESKEISDALKRE
jgi:hypothetical protein